MSPKRRVENKHLPARVYQKHGAYYFVDNNNRWIRLGKSLSEAMQAWAELAEMPLKNNTMNAVFDRYMQEVASVKAITTYKNNIHSIKFLRIFFGDMAPDSVTPVDVYKFMDIRAQATKVQANREKALLSHVFTMAIRWGIVGDNPCRNVKKFKESKRNRYITDKEFKAVYDIASPFIRSVMQVAYVTGLRLSDVLNIKLSDITPEGLEVKVQKTGGKMIIERTEGLTEALAMARAITKRLGSFYLFSTKTGKPYSKDGFKSIWQRVMTKALDSGKLQERFHFHDIRRKTATDAEQAKGREYARQLLGHSTQKMTGHYISGAVKVKPLK
jgi:integrase